MAIRRLLLAQYRTRLDRLRIAAAVLRTREYDIDIGRYETLLSRLGA